MPQVPRYDNPTVGIAPVATPQATPLGADAFGAGLARGMQQVSGDLFKIAEEERLKEESTAFKKAKIETLGASTSILDGQSNPDGTVTPGLLQAQGTNAKGLEDKYRTAFQGITSKAKEALKDYPAAAQLYDEWAAEHYVQNAKALNLRQISETQKDALATTQVMVDTAKDTMLRAYNAGQEVDIFDPQSDLAKAVYDAGKLQGWNQQVTNRKLGEIRSNLIADMIQSSLKEKDLASAKQIYADFGEYIGSHDKAVVEQLGSAVKEEENWQISESAAKTTFDKYKPANVNQALNLQTMRDEIRKDDSLDHDQKKLAEQRVEEYGREYQQQRRIDEEFLANLVNQLQQKGGRYSDIKREITNDETVDSQAKGHLYDWLDHKFHIDEARQEAKQEARLQRHLSQLSNLFTFQQKYLRGDYGTLTPAQVATKFPAQLGAATDNAMQFVETVNSDLGKAKLDHNEFIGMVRIMRENKDYAKLLPNPESKEDRDQAKMALLQDRVTQIMAAGKDAPGKRVSVKDAMVQAIQGVTTNVGWFSDTKEPMYVIGTDLSTEYGKNPAKWPREAQNQFIQETFYANPKNKGKFLTFKQMEIYRKKLIGGN